MESFRLTTTASAEDMPEQFSGPREAGRALVGVARGWRVFLQIAVPWALVLAVSLALLEMIGPSSHGTTFQALAVLLGDPLLVIAALDDPAMPGHGHASALRSPIWRPSPTPSGSGG